MATATLELAPTPALEMLSPVDSDKRYEVIDGELKEKPPMGATANRVATILARKLDFFAEEHDLGLVFTQECAYQIFPHDPRKTRKPDVSFISKDRLTEDDVPDGNMQIVPGLIVEVVSTHDLAEDLEERIDEYLRVGVNLIWLVHPATHTIYVIRRDGTGERLTGEKELKGEDVIPGFSCPLRELFRKHRPQ
jgi:Uma2 family endonuclease